MISISRTTADAAYGNIILQEKPNTVIIDKTPRVSRSKTLDGGAFISNMGFSHGDRDLKIVARINKQQEWILNSIVENSEQLIFATKDGVFLGYIENMKSDSGDLTLNVLILRKA